MALVFDNNRSLFRELDKGQLADPVWYIQKCRPKLGKDFMVTARGLLTPKIQNDLKNLSGFHVRQHPDILLSQKRIALLEKMINDRLTALLWQNQTNKGGVIADMLPL